MVRVWCTQHIPEGSISICNKDYHSVLAYWLHICSRNQIIHAFLQIPLFSLSIALACTDFSFVPPQSTVHSAIIYLSILLLMDICSHSSVITKLFSEFLYLSLYLEVELICSGVFAYSTWLVGKHTGCFSWYSHWPNRSVAVASHLANTWYCYF